jgi:hypothetical protein
VLPRPRWRLSQLRGLFRSHSLQLGWKRWSSAISVAYSLVRAPLVRCTSAAPLRSRRVRGCGGCARGRRHLRYRRTSALTSSCACIARSFRRRSSLLRLLKRRKCNVSNRSIYPIIDILYIADVLISAIEN